MSNTVEKSGGGVFNAASRGISATLQQDLETSGLSIFTFGLSMYHRWIDSFQDSGPIASGLTASPLMTLCGLPCTTFTTSSEYSATLAFSYSLSQEPWSV